MKDLILLSSNRTGLHDSLAFLCVEGPGCTTSQNAYLAEWIIRRLRSIDNPQVNTVNTSLRSFHDLCDRWEFDKLTYEVRRIVPFAPYQTSDTFILRKRDELGRLYAQLTTQQLEHLRMFYIFHSFIVP